MVRVKLALLLLAVISALVAVGTVTQRNVADDLVVQAVSQLTASNDVVRLADAVVDYSLMVEASEAARLDAVTLGMACPVTPDALREAQRLVPDPSYVPPADAGPDDVVPMVPGTRCTGTQHVEVLNALKAWNAMRDPIREANENSFLTERAPGTAVPRTPDLLLVADLDGVVVARVGFDKDDWFGDSRPNMSTYPVLGRTALGDAQADIIVWREDAAAQPQLAQVGTAPVLDADGTVVGATMVGYFLTDEAALEAALPRVDVAYFYRTAGTSVSFAGTTFSSRPQFLRAMQDTAFTRLQPDGRATQEQGVFADVALGTPGTLWQFTNGDQDFAVMSTALSNDDAGTSIQSGFIVVTSLSTAVAPVITRQAWLPGLGVLLALLGVLGILVALKQYERPIEEISRGLQEVIAGNRDYMWEVDEKSHLSDMAHSLNVMSARLQGKRDPDAEEVEGADEWAAMTGGGGAAQAAAAPAKPAGIGGLGGLRGRAAADDEDEDEDDA